ncbi:hypothetical protein CSUI_007862, partial [Cystoisospora suis]
PPARPPNFPFDLPSTKDEEKKMRQYKKRKNGQRMKRKKSSRREDQPANRLETRPSSSSLVVY